MMYPFMTLEDNTEIVHSEALITEGKEKVKVYIEKPIDGGFQSAECYLPDYQWKNIVGFNDADIAIFQELLESTAHIIIRLSRGEALIMPQKYGYLIPENVCQEIIIQRFHQKH